MPNPQPSDIPRPFDWAQTCPEYAPAPPVVDVAAHVARLRAMFPTPAPRQWVHR